MTDLATVRLLINDLAADEADRSFTDDDLQLFLDLEGDVKLAAAQVLDVIASNEALVSKRIRTLDLQVDGTAVAKSLREHASALRTQAADAIDSDEGGAFELTTLIGTPDASALISRPWPFV